RRPAWVDEKLLTLGSSVCMKTGHNALIVLRDYTMIVGYDFAYLNKPLIFTGILRNGVFKRLSETLKFWVNVTRRDALHLHHNGYEEVIKVRIVHALARTQILDKFD